MLYQDDHYLLIQALSISGTNIKSLLMNADYSYPVPTQYFEKDTKTGDYTSIARHAVSAFCNLKSLSLLIGFTEFSKHDGENSLDGLQSCLAQISSLTNLDLQAGDWSNEESWWDLIGPTTWPHLRRFSISGPRFEGRHLAEFVERHSLEYFEMGEMVLIDLYWDDTLDLISECMLDTTEISISGPLCYDHGDYESWEKLECDNKDIREQIEKYMKFGGVNPLSRENFK